MLEVKELCKQYTGRDKKGRKTTIQAVDNVSFIVERNKSYALVGESGSGKSTLARLITHIEMSTSGQIKIDNKDMAKMGKRELRMKRADFQMVMQDGQSSLDPRIKIYDSIAEPIRNFSSVNKKEEKEKIENLIQKVELPLEVLNRFPHELSGGQQKRICIARAISVRPKFIIFDEAVSGLDVTVRKKILDLLLRLRNELKSTYFFITHDIDVAMYIAKNILVMKDGKIVEQIENIKSFSDFKHEYSQMLIKSLLPKLPSNTQRK